MHDVVINVYYDYTYVFIEKRTYTLIVCCVSDLHYPS